jgi:hypothetical protein
MQYKRFENEVVMILTSGDDIAKSICEVCEKENIKMGTITGFGGLKKIKVGIWNNEKGAYNTLEKENISMELTNLTGNISTLDGKLNTHMHATFCDDAFHTYGGHVLEGECQNLIELYIYPGKDEIKRKKVQSWYFMDLDEE